MDQMWSLWKQNNLNAEVAGALRCPHQNLGYSPSRELAKHLRLSGASQDMVEKCVRPPFRPVAKPAAFLDFNEAIAVDIIFLDTQESKANLALNMGTLDRFIK